LYLQYFGLNEAPFSITPDPAFVYLSAAHRDALAHLLYGVGQGGSGGFVQLTGEVGTGKTTLCRCLLEQVPPHAHVALVLNPLMTPQELLATICEELGIDTAGIRGSNKSLVDALNAYLLEQHALGRRVVVVIDEAQNLSPDALEQVRLLTNLETAKEKLMQVVLLGQPELRQLLQRQNLRQLAQRVTARYHLAPLDREETRAYVLHRMKVAGAPRNPFRRSALRALYRRSGGIPRLINIIADRSLAAAYAGEKAYVTERMVNAAAQEVRPSETRVRSTQWPSLAAAAAALLLAVALVVWGPWTADRPGSGAAAEPRVADTLEPEQPADGTDRAPSEDPAPPAAEPVESGDAPAPPTPAQAYGGVAGPAAVQPGARPGLQSDWLEQQHRRAWVGMAELWGDADSAGAIQAACDGMARTGFGCIRDQGNWARIRQLGLPVVLVLRDAEARLVLLAGMSANQLIVGWGSNRSAVGRDAIEDRWLGEYYVAWPQAPDWPMQIQRGEVGPAVEIVMDMAAFAQPAWSGSRVFDEQFESWLMAFQRRNGLKVDGIVGPNTLIHLMAPTISEPRLATEATERS
jgi:general secretion pathway protein A